MTKNTIFYILREYLCDSRKRNTQHVAQSSKKLNVQTGHLKDPDCEKSLDNFSGVLRTLGFIREYFCAAKFIVS